MKIREKIYLLSGASYGKLGNVYAVKYQGGYFLIDSGVPEALDTIRENMRYWGIPEEQVTHVFITHAHDDHCGCCADFQKKGAKICIGLEDAEMLKAGNLGEMSPCTNHVMPACVPDVLIAEDREFDLGDVKIYSYKMPGHTDGTVVYYTKIDEEYVLFTGDFFYPYGERGEFAATGWKGDLTYSQEKLTESFERLYGMKLRVTLLLSGHGVPLFGENAQDCTRAAFKYHILNNR